MLEGKQHCCERLTRQVKFNCKTHKSPFECPDAIVIFNPTFAEYGLIIHDGGTSVLLIDYCLWCGTKLPESKRNEWFDAIDKMEISRRFE